MEIDSIKTAACYVRVSTDDQLEYSPDSQIKIIQEYAKKHSILLPEEFIFQEEDGVSGRKAEKRPEFQRMIAIAKQKPRPFDSILVWKFSRFARNQEESIVYKSMLHRDGVEVVSVSEPLIDGPFGGLIERIIEWMDEYYSLNLAGEVKRGMKERVSRGLPVNAAPYGYVYKDGEYEISPQEAENVRFIFNKFANGEPSFAIAHELNALGTGRIWENRTVDYILQNPAYIGKLRTGIHNRSFDSESVEIYDGKHASIIDLPLWEYVQKKMLDRKRAFRSHDHTANAKKRTYNGILRCSKCGATLASGGKTNSWQCTRYMHGKCTESHYTTTDSVTAAVAPTMIQDFKSGNFLGSLTVQSHSETLPEQIDRQIDQVKIKLKRVREAYEAGIYTLEEFADSRAKIQQELDRLAAEKVPVPLDKQQIKEEFLRRNQQFLDIFLDPKSSPEEKNSALHQYVLKIVFCRSANRYDIFYKL